MNVIFPRLFWIAMVSMESDCALGAQARAPRHFFESVGTRGFRSQVPDAVPDALSVRDASHGVKGSHP